MEISATRIIRVSELSEKCQIPRRNELSQIVENARFVAPSRGRFVAPSRGLKPSPLIPKRALKSSGFMFFSIFPPIFTDLRVELLLKTESGYLRDFISFKGLFRGVIAAFSHAKNGPKHVQNTPRGSNTADRRTCVSSSWQACYLGDTAIHVPLRFYTITIGLTQTGECTPASSGARQLRCAGTCQYQVSQHVEMRL